MRPTCSFATAHSCHRCSGLFGSFVRLLGRSYVRVKTICMAQRCTASSDRRQQAWLSKMRAWRYYKQIHTFHLDEADMSSPRRGKIDRCPEGETAQHPRSLRERVSLTAKSPSFPNLTAPVSRHVTIHMLMYTFVDVLLQRLIGASRSSVYGCLPM